MATVMESAFNLAGYFVARRPGLLLRARKEMEAALLRQKLAWIKLEARLSPSLDSEDEALAVRHLGARRVGRNRGGGFPGDRNWALAGRRERRVA